jgi:hypothetical protein
MGGRDRLHRAPGVSDLGEAVMAWTEADDLAVWKKDGGPRPAKRHDGWPTRSDTRWMSDAELAIRQAMVAVEKAGGSPALTDAINLLSAAMDRVADHVERQNS